ncbi:motility associated factor glycosyltransferase family protein [Pseudoalteromonas lipolytica]|uniref:Uncharacterized conserved protein n=1 Tax=Pseudoalteromonas lipolytica TaxID=570156 RepID=A0ABY1GDN0_9GAMM|nr:6-hydroxymethylpterin diphosphokinase MptE-like protein [Pseudoalteromonas lipolytica]MBE0351608.1 hypothetical protein [Pseudoalteromonas lipolytica LMEB 39]SFT49237.1 Uncharacterized conserved protein [Pseudoalteromonas lipolytica]
MNKQELELKSMILQATLLSNLEFLKQVMPTIYEVFLNYQPSGTGVAIDDGGNVNLFNNGQFVYSESPHDLAKKQVNVFLDNPVYSSYDIKHANDESISFKHEALLKSIYNVRNAETGGKIPKPTNEKRLDFVCFLGGGLGYQIVELVNRKNVLNIFLFEPNLDCFYALLHCVELKPLSDKCISQGGTFNITVGGDEHKVVNDISKLLFEQGHFNLSLIYFFKHYDSDTISKIMGAIKEFGHRWHGGWGFFEDEIIGISHTLSNLNSKFPVLKKANSFKNILKKSDVFLVANGPSLDSAIEFLKSNQDNVIIISCGTALKALLINNIKPDIHVEMERTAGLSNYVKAVERTEGITIKLSEINIVALNTVYDGILKRFKAAHLLTKVNDAGGHLIRRLDKKMKYAYPMYSNPTVTNTGLAVATELGFEKLYLVGADFGFVSQNYHHSKHSIYFDNDFQHKEVVDENMQTNMVVKGNFRDEILTTNIFDSSKSAVELLLQNKPRVKVFNTSDGALIKYTKPKRIDDVKINNKLSNKQEKVAALLKEASSREQLFESNVNAYVADVRSRLKSFLEVLLELTPPSFVTREELASAFSAQNKMLLKMQREDEIVFILVQGTLKYFHTYIMASSYYYSDLNKRAEFINACLDSLFEHVNDIFIEFTEYYDKPAKV